MEFLGGRTRPTGLSPRQRLAARHRHRRFRLDMPQLFEDKRWRVANECHSFRHSSNPHRSGKLGPKVARAPRACHLSSRWMEWRQSNRSANDRKGTIHLSFSSIIFLLEMLLMATENIDHQVAGIVGRADILATLFFLSSFICYHR